MNEKRGRFLRERYRILADSDTFLFTISPHVHIPTLHNSDFINGFVSRFFLKKINDIPIMEIDQYQYDSFLSSPFYEKSPINWKITGPRNNVVNKGRVEIEGVEDHNLKEIQTAELTLRGMKQKLPNSLQFWRGF